MLWHSVGKKLILLLILPQTAKPPQAWIGEPLEVSQYKQDSNESQVNNFTLPDKAIECLASARRITVLTGAGISAESGLGTFRGKEGIWNKMKPEDLASMAGFMANRDLVWDWYNYRRSVLSSAKPNAAHLALAEWGNVCSDFTLVTQNVDGLHHVAGQQIVHELHGNIRVNRCLRCEQEVTDCLLDSSGGIPYCPCGGAYRPGVVWFGEMLPEHVLQQAIAAAETCDLFLTIGTSAVVYPAASLPKIAADCGAKTMEVNIEQTQFSSHATCSVYAPATVAVPALFLYWQRIHIPVSPNS